MENWKEHLIDAYSRFHAAIPAERETFPELVPFDVCEAASSAAGGFAWKWGVADEIMETINLVNAWGMRVHQWWVWMQVIDGYEDPQERYELDDHFLEPIVFFCMFQPSGLADRLLEVAENSLHQANLTAFPGEPDKLDQDDLRKGRWLDRKKQRKQLDRLGARWRHYPAFRQLWSRINSAQYRQTTRNFRNLSAHSFAPRFQIGQIGRAYRSIESDYDIVKQDDDTYVQVPHPERKCVSYAMGLVEPIPYREAHAANLREYKHALTAMHAFIGLIEELCGAMNKRKTALPASAVEPNYGGRLAGRPD